MRPKLAGRDFLMPWNIAKEYWDQYDKAATERMLFPFNAEPIDQFVAKYKGTKDVPLFQSKLVCPVIPHKQSSGILERRVSFLVSS